MTGVQQMEIIFHTGKDSEQSLRQFAEKRAEFLSRELRDLNAEELKALLSTLKEDHRTFENEDVPIIMEIGWFTHRPGKEDI